METIISAVIGALSAIIICLINTWTQSKKMKLELKEKNESMVNEIKQAVKDLSVKVDNLEDKFDEQNAIQCRSRILRFGDEILHNLEHSKEHFESTLIDIDDYEDYCDHHPDFRNNKTVTTTKRIKDVYEERLSRNDFL